MKTKHTDKPKNQDQDWEKEWEGVEHFKSYRQDEPIEPEGALIIANCGLEEWRSDGIPPCQLPRVPQDCPICIAIEEAMSRMDQELSRPSFLDGIIGFFTSGTK